MTDTLLQTLQTRFEAHMPRHPGVPFPGIPARLAATLYYMEETGGEPDVVLLDGVLYFADCAAETPAGRRNLCYDDDALAARKANKPIASAVGLAAAHGLALLTPAQYQALQRLGPVDTRTSSWLATPAAIRAQGGALFGDHRYGETFVYHNGAASYYAARGYRGLARL